MNIFSELCVRHNCDKGLLSGGVGHGYCRHYASVLDPIRDKPIRLVEIGVGDGKSIRVWLDYFTHPNTRIIGVDKDVVMASQPRFDFIQGDQTDGRLLSSLALNRYDVVIDDGSHMSNGIIPTFEALWPSVVSGGYYFIEDLRCSYMPGYDVHGWPSQMHFVQQLLHDINAQTNYKPAPDSTFVYPQGTDGGRGIDWLRFSEELCVIKKK